MEGRNQCSHAQFQKLPDPWLYDTDALIRDLDSVRELILRIPVHNDTVLPTNAAISAVWDLRERIRELAALRLTEPAPLEEQARREDADRNSPRRPPRPGRGRLDGSPQPR